MKKNKFIISIFLLLFFSSLNVSVFSKTNPIPNSSENKFPAFNKELIINIKGDPVSAYAFIASGKVSKETVILIAGYPGNDNNFDIAQAIRRNGKNVIHFNHRGAWGSRGFYTYSNCLEDVGEIIKYFSQSKVANELRISPQKFTLLGRSYGGGIALIKGSQIDSVKKIIAISSVNYGEIMKKYKSLDELSGFKKYMEKQIMINTNIDGFLQEMLDKKYEFNILNYKDSLKNKKVLIIEDSKKNEGWIKKLAKIEYRLLESDHNFIEERLELTNLIVSWLNIISPKS